MEETNEILELLKDRPELQSKMVFEHNYEEVEKILSLKEIDDPKFKHVFTSNIWKSSYRNIKLILEMKEWDDPKYKHLLTSGV